MAPNSDDLLQSGSQTGRVGKQKDPRSITRGLTFSDPFGLCPRGLLCALANLAAGFGDALTLGATNLVRNAIDANDVIDKGSAAYLGGTAVGMAASVVLTEGLGAAAEGTSAARSIGQAGETAAGIAKNTARIPSLTGTAAYRIPDALSAATLTEVKNVARLSFTSQLRDFATFAGQSGRGFDLFVRGSTELSAPLRQAISSGDITLRFLP